MMRPCFGVLCLVSFTLAARADDPATDKLAAIQAAYRDAEKAQLKAMTANADGDRTQALERAKAHAARLDQCFREATELARADAKSPAAFTALEWALTLPRLYYSPEGSATLDLAREEFSADPRIGKLVAYAGYLGMSSEHSRKAATGFIERVAEKNPERSVRAQARMSQAQAAMHAYSRASRQHAPDAEALARSAETAFLDVVKEYGDCPWLMRGNDSTIEAHARHDLRELQSLRVGRVAPEIKSEAVNGQAFKLSDLRGKVTVVVFWAKWCGPCMRMVPHERELAERLREQPFALVGVNGDPSREVARKTMTAEGMTWPSFWNGGPGGTITTAWNVRSWPTIYVLDAHGVVRYRNVRGAQLDQAVDTLLKELHEQAGATHGR